MKKGISILLCMILLFVFSVTTFAESNIEVIYRQRNILSALDAYKVDISEPNEIDFEIIVNTEEEYFDILEEIYENNQYVEQLWEQAEECAEEQNDSDIGMQAVASSSKVAKANAYLSNKQWGNYKLYLAAYCTFNQMFNGSTYTFGTIHDIGVYGTENGTKVSNAKIVKTQLMDSKRTLAVNASFLATVKSATGKESTISFLAYIEFYAKNLTGRWYTLNGKSVL